MIVFTCKTLSFFFVYSLRLRRYNNCNWDQFSWHNSEEILVVGFKTLRDYYLFFPSPIEMYAFWVEKIPRLRWISKIFVKCVVKYILVMYGRVIYFFARQIEIGLYVGNDYELWCSIALHRVRFYKDSGITD